MSRDNPRNEAWARYYENNPGVLAVWGESNGREPSLADQGFPEEDLCPARSAVGTRCELVREHVLTDHDDHLGNVWRDEEDVA